MVVELPLAVVLAHDGVHVLEAVRTPALDGHAVVLSHGYLLKDFADLNP
jgi:hypothetical protein